MTRTWFAVMSIVGVCAVTPPVLADIINVPGDFRCIQEAIDAAVNGDEVVVADGTYTGACNKNLDFQDKAITLRSESGNRDACIIDCENVGRFASFGAGDTAVVQSITVMRGSAGGGSGGAVFLFGGSPSFTDCVFEDCDAGTHGGALYVLNGTATIEGCLFDVNTAGSRGGAIYASGSSVALVDTELDGNHAEGNGGGMHILRGEATVSGCSFTGNTANEGGGLRVSDNGKLICTDSSFTANITVCGGAGILASMVDPASLISGCQFTDNVAQGDCGGGGFASIQDFSEISNCIFQGNEAFFGAGVLFRNFNTTRVENVLFLNNTATFGGGASLDGSASPEFVNCLFAGNRAVTNGSAGGGLEVFDSSTATLINCTFSGNSSEEFGGALTASDNSQVELVNCVLWDNDAPDGSEIHIGYPGFDSGTVTVSYSDVAGGEDGVSVDGVGTLIWGAGNIDEDPLFVTDPTCGDYFLSPGSPCIDAADNAAVPRDITTDLCANPRFVDDLATDDTGNGEPPVDMGAYEFQPCEGDANGDGTVDPLDSGYVLARFGCPVGTGDANCDAADQNGDGAVDPLDSGFVLARFGPCP